MAQDLTSADIFRFEWEIYRKIAAADLFCHSAVARLLDRELSSRFSRPIRFLELACGDGSLARSLLQKHATRSYRGIDLSPMALELARANMSGASFEVTLEESDMLSALHQLQEPVDVIWCSLSLHHLEATEKKSLFRVARKGLSADGIMGIYEPVLPERTNRAAFMEGIAEGLRSAWAVLDPREFDHMWRHIRQFDFPETLQTWKQMGLSARFSAANCRYRLPGPMPCAMLIYEAQASNGDWAA